MNKQKRQLPDSFFECLKNIKRAEPNPYLFEKIKYKINQLGYQTVSSKQFLIALSLIVILLILNIATLSIIEQKEYPNATKTEKFSMQSLFVSYQIYKK